MKYHLLVLFILTLLSACNSKYADLDPISPRPPFITQLGDVTKMASFDNTGSEACTDIVVDRFDNSYCAGQTNGSMAATLQGTTDAWIAKFNRQGKLLWIKQFGTAGTDICQSVGVDYDGNVYCGGTTDRIIGFNTGTVQIRLNDLSMATRTSETDTDAFVAKLNSSGDIQWIKQFGSIGEEGCANIAVSQSGNSYCGSRTTYVIGTTNTGVVENKGCTNQDPYVAKINTRGESIWIRQIAILSSPAGQSCFNDFCTSIAIDDAENSYCAGGTAASLVDTNVDNANDVFLWAIDSDGKDKFKRQIGTTTVTSNPSMFVIGGSAGSQNCEDVDVDKDGNIYCVANIVGNFAEIVGGGSDGTLIKWDQNGSLLWVRQYGAVSLINPPYANTASDLFRGIAVSDNGTIHVAGLTDGNMLATRQGPNDLIGLIFDSSGNYLSGKQLGSTGQDTCYAADVDDLGNFYLGCDTWGNVGEAPAAPGVLDALIIRLGPTAEL